MNSVRGFRNRFASTNEIFQNSKKQTNMEAKGIYRYVPSLADLTAQDGELCQIIF